MVNQAEHSVKKGIITFTVMLVTIIEVLDMTIVNVALPPMMGSLNASVDEITWVLTAYIVSSAVLMPLTGYLTDRLGQKKLLIINIVGFLISSIFCGLAQHLGEMVFFRITQGIFGASLVPLSQLILRQIYSEKEFAKAMAIWGIGIMTAPVLGPTIGGYITEHLSWRWVFYINVPVCILALSLAFSFIEESPKRQRSIDWTGLVLMVLAIAALQVGLDRGNALDWFSSDLITSLFFISIVSGIIFIVRGLTTTNNIINLHLFKDKIFALSTLLISFFIAVIMGVIALQPILLEQLLGYPTELTGLAMAPRGIASAVAMGMAANLLQRFSAKSILMFGLGISAIGTYEMVHYSLNSPLSIFLWTGAIQGFGMGLFFVPLSTYAFTTLAKKDLAEASGLFGFGRSLGSSIGISTLTTVLSRQTQVNWQQLGEHLTLNNANLVLWLNSHHWQSKSPIALKELSYLLHQRAMMNGFINCFAVASLLLILLIPLLLTLPRTQTLSQKYT